MNFVATNSLNVDPNVYELHKPVDRWSNRDRKGSRLVWDGLHAKARTFLFSEATLGQLSDENTEYALALIEGADLSAWHDTKAWKDVAERAKRSAVTHFDAEQMTILRMTRTVLDTVKNSRGQDVTRKVKVKRLGFPSDAALQDHIGKLAKDQDWCCAITGIQLEFDSECDDIERSCSLDRIDSEGHYEPGNLQVVCRFVNRWKNDGSNEEFLRLIALVRGQSR